MPGYIPAEQRDAGGEQLQISTHVRDQVDLEAEYRTVAHRGDLDILDQVSAVDRDLAVLAAGLGPLDRDAELLGEDDPDCLLGVHVELGAEAAADVGRDDSQT